MHHYFEANLITVVSHASLSDNINNRGAIRRIAKWAIKLLQFEITYKPRLTIKSQALADFIVWSGRRHNRFRNMSISSIS